MLVYSVAQFVDLFENLASNSNSINTVKQVCVFLYQYYSKLVEYGYWLLWLSDP